METLEPFNIIYQTAEDGLGDTVKTRLMEAEADLERVLVIDDKMCIRDRVCTSAGSSVPRTSLAMLRRYANRPGAVSYTHLCYRQAGPPPPERVT